MSIVSGSPDMTALSVLVDDLPGDIVRGTPVEVRSRALSLSSGRALVRWFRNTPVFTGTIEPVAPATLLSATRSLAHARASLAASGSRDGLLAVALSETSLNAYSLRAAVLLKKPVPQALAGLVGLGPGFTPSGDDFVCGSLAADIFWGPAKPQDLRPILKRLSPAKRERDDPSDVTTPGGAALVWLACRRSFPRLLTSFARALLLADMTAVEVEVRRILSHGATSGADMLAGFVWMSERILDGPCP